MTDLELKLTDRIGNGGFADIFCPQQGSRVFKLFRRLSDIAIAHVAPHVFASEITAYERASADPRASKYVPQFFGPQKVRRVIAADGSDMSDSYWLDLCYSVARLAPDPNERKFGSFYQGPLWSKMQRIEAIFEQAGISHLGDASILHWNSDQPMLIDFGSYDAAARHMKIIERAV